jgi:hypothetical protein
MTTKNPFVFFEFFVVKKEFLEVAFNFIFNFINSLESIFVTFLCLCGEE